MTRNLNKPTESQIPQPSTVTTTTLAPLVQYAMQNSKIQVLNWHHEQLHGGVGKGTAIYRYSGDSEDHGRKIPWSLILKTVQPSGNRSVHAWDYYKREVDAYQSGWLNTLPGGLSAPRLFGVTESADGTCWIWLEDVNNDVADPWPLAHYRVVARHIGQLNGTFLTQETLPDHSWLSRDWIRHYVEQSAPCIDLLHQSQDHPLVRRWLPEELMKRVFHLWDDRDLFLNALDRLPQTICHFDVHRRNLFARRVTVQQFETLLIDWAFVGHGPVGADLNPLMNASVAFFDVDVADAQRFEDLIFEGYLTGLHDVGWDGNRQDVRLGYAASCVRYALGTLGPVLMMIFDQNSRLQAEQAFHCSIGDLLNYWGHIRHYFGYMEDEARRLIKLTS
ncbi:MAG: phosphotransferase [Candidatus Bathyarchaeota archaeon]|nr:MAG: phosphotransferase [Candidatus Bathyarchaeota archaeon]